MRKLLIIFLLSNILIAYTNASAGNKDYAQKLNKLRVLYPKFWHKAKKLAGLNNHPNINPPGFKIKDIGTAGLFTADRYEIYLSPSTIKNKTPGWTEYFLLHELIHAALYKKGYDIKIHHCWMAYQSIPVRSAKWIVKTILPPTPLQGLKIIQKSIEWQMRFLNFCLNDTNR